MFESFKTYIKNRNIDQLLDLLSAHPEVLDQEDENGVSGLVFIAYNGLGEVLNKATELKRSFTFHEAIVCGKKEIVADNLQKDAGVVNAYSKDGYTPLSLAAFFNQTLIATLLLENGANPNLCATNPSKVNALHSAVARQNVALCKLLIAYGADVNKPQTQNVTALHAAAHHGNLELVKLLVEHGAKIDLKMDNGNTAIDFAEKDGHLHIKSYLAERMNN